MKTSDIARLMEMFQVCFLVSHLRLHTDTSVPRAPSLSIGTSSHLTMRTYGLIRLTLRIIRLNTRRSTLSRSPSGGESGPRDELKQPTRGRGGSTRHFRSKARVRELHSANPATGRKGNVPRRRFQSFSLTRLTSCV